MYVRFGHTARQLIVEYLTSLFKHQTQWSNTDRPGKIAFASSATPDVFEEFAKEPERYPIITVGNRGSQPAPSAIDGYLDQAAYSESLGDHATFYTTIGDGDKAAARIIPTADATWYTAKISGVRVYGTGEMDDLVVVVASGSSVATATNVASGTVKAFDSTTPCDKTVLLNPAVSARKSQPYWVVMSTAGAGRYCIPGDDSAASGSAGGPVYYRATQASGSDWQTISGSTYVLSVSDRPYDQRGGLRLTTVEIGVEAKDQVAADQIADICCIYLELARRTRLTRLTDVGVTDSLVTDAVGDLLKKGVAITEVRKGNTTTRQRGNDNVFRVPITVTLYSTWYDEFGKEYLEDIILTVNNYT